MPTLPVPVGSNQCRYLAELKVRLSFPMVTVLLPVRVPSALYILLAIEAILSPAEATPFIVSVRVVPARERTLVFMIGTEAPATLLTVVVRLFAADVLLTVLTAGAVATTPSTVLVMVLTALDRVL